ncbi:MAG: hypothetical protein ACYDCL_11245 [Myxococcales bacterium]
MEPCPVCETPHPPGALECVTCGRVFAAAAAAIAAARLPELEPTALVTAAVAVPPELVPGLEVTSLGDAAAVPLAPQVVPGLETTMLPAPASAVAVESLPDLERTVQDPVGGPSPRVVICRGCGATGQAQGLYCDRCGMRLSRPPPEDLLTPVEGEPLEEGAATQCRACGARRIVNGICADCGVPV